MPMPMPMQPHNMTDDELLTEAERQYPADPLIAALVKMAAGELGDLAAAKPFQETAEEYGCSDAEELEKDLQELERWIQLAHDYTENGTIEELKDVLAGIERFWVCADCYLTAGDADAEKTFSRLRCQCCGDVLAGSRHEITRFEPSK